ncbi:MAG TPA: SCP2 sterol-binding domain-containing protein [Stellaceae bacterium]|nr:SCP2 sterol-binding domain-containing protein [Stellaceae bacterium]
MSLDGLIEAVRAKAALNLPLGYKAQFDLGDDGVIFWDGTVSPPIIDDTAHDDVDTTLTLSAASLRKMLNGGLNPTLAYMTGALKVAGSMGVALKINQMLED